MEKYMYEAVLVPNELGGYDASFPELGMITQGNSLSDAAFMAQDLLALWIESELAEGKTVAAVGRFGSECPEGGKVMGIATTAGAGAALERTMTVQEAADVLDVSTSRVYAMVRNGVLRSEKVGTSRLVLAEDVIAYFNSPRAAGRPKKAAVA